MTAEALIGTWDLVSLYGESKEGEIWQVYGEHPLGTLIYTPEGTMATILMQQGRPSFSSDLTNPSPEELQAAFFGFDAYCGSYTLDTDNRSVTHHLMASRLPSWEGTDQVRFYEIEGEKLTIRSAPIPARGTEWIVTVVWTRHP